MNIAGILPGIRRIPKTQSLQDERTHQPSFMQFIWQKKENRAFLWIAFVGIILQFIVFKLLYPFPDFFSDSYSYLYAAYAHLDLNIWPIGYSKFLAVFHSLTHSDIALVGFQYFFLELAALYFYFTLLYFFRAVKYIRIILFIFLFFNPLFLYLCNYVNSDPLFAALSLCWFTELIWIIQRPRLYQIFTQGILLFLAFTVRNNAYYYPLIAVLAFILSSQRLRIKWAGSILGPLLILPFIYHTQQIAKQMTGTEQFSLFTGWQLANNALYMRDQIEPDLTNFPSEQTKELDQLAQEFFMNVPDLEDYRYSLESYVGNFFIRESSAPLKKFVATHYTSNDGNSIAAFGKASVVFKQYGIYLIRSHPLTFIRYYLLLNTKNYFLPPLEKLEVYNLGKDEAGGMAQLWFNWSNQKMQTVSKNLQGNVLVMFPFLFLWLNILLLGGLTWIMLSKQYKTMNRSEVKILLLISGFWMLNFCFSVFATINVFRYQVFPMIIFLTGSLLLLGLLGKKTIAN